MTKAFLKATRMTPKMEGHAELKKIAKPPAPSSSSQRAVSRTSARMKRRDRKNSLLHVFRRACSPKEENKRHRLMKRAGFHATCKTFDGYECAYIQFRLAV